MQEPTPPGSPGATPVAPVTADALVSRFAWGAENSHELPGDVDMTYGELGFERAPKKVPLSEITIEFKDNVAHPPELAEYIVGELNKVGIRKGYFVIWAKNIYISEGGSRWTSYKFNKKAECPICHGGCDYGFDYKIKTGEYAGWKCWKTNEWMTCYDQGGLVAMGY